MPGRYRIGEDPASAVGYGTSDEVITFTVVLSLAIGIGRQRWLAVWSAGLVIASLAYLGWLVVR